MEYLILDFGDVIFYPTTGDWFLTPKFYELVDVSYFSEDLINRAKKEAAPILDRHAVTLEDEYKLFLEYYTVLLETMGYPISKELVEHLAYDYTYKSTKCCPYASVKTELTNLKRKYKLIMLTDNWPCCFRLLKEHGLDKFFEKVYVSSIYDCLKQDGIFFDFPINDFEIKNGIFVDDKENLLDVAVSKGLDVRLMDRKKNITKSKYKIINRLDEIE